VDVDVQAVLSIALERPSVSFGNATTGSTPAPVSEKVTVASNGTAGYSLTVRRAAFTPADLPLGIAGTAPTGGQIGGALAGGAIAPVPVGPAADLLVGTTSAAGTGAGDVWNTRLGFASPLPSVPAGRYTTTVTFTVIGR
jgi:spore coat protein U-like protein